MKNKVIFITSSKFMKRDFVRFGLKIFYDYGYQIEIINITQYISPEILYNQEDHYYDEALFNFTIIDTLQSLEKLIDKNCKSICILKFDTQCNKGYDILKILQSPNIVTVKTFLGLIPKWQSNLEYHSNNQFKQIIRVFFILKKNRNLFKLLNKIQKKLFLFFRKRLYIDYVLTSNKETFLEVSSGRKYKNLLEIHSMDYDKYLEARNKKDRLYEKKYVVFVDQNLMFHEDFKRINADINFDIQKYFNDLNNFFNIIERLYGVDVVISAHPRVEKKTYSKYYDNRKMFFNKTEYLIKDSEFVIFHYSTSINYAILFQKQILFITNKTLNDNFSIGERIGQYSNIVDQPLISIDKELNILPQLKDINLKKYREYKNKYIKKDETVEDYIWNVFYKIIQKSFFHD